MIPNPHPGIFIVFEGIDGCGKTVQMNHVYGWLKTLNDLRHHYTLKTKEPNKEKPFGKKIYTDLANTTPDALHKNNPFGFQTWYACDSKENLRDVVIPALTHDDIVLCDRFRPSMVYGANNFGDISKLMTMNCEIIGEDFIWPDLILIFDINANKAVERLKKKGLKLDEHEKSEVLTRVRRNYMHFAQVYPSCEVINADQPEDKVFEDVKKEILIAAESKFKHTILT